jgi:hypothetical protein
MKHHVWMISEQSISACNSFNCLPSLPEHELSAHASIIGTSPTLTYRPSMHTRQLSRMTRVQHRRDYLAIPQTRLCDKQLIVPSNSCECVTQRNNRRDTENAADVAAVYLNLHRVTTCLPVGVTVNSRIRCTYYTFDDVWLTDVTVVSGTSLLVPCMFIQAHHSEVLTSFSLSLVPHATTLRNFQPQIEAPNLLWGDFKVDITLKQGNFQSFEGKFESKLRLKFCYHSK